MKKIIKNITFILKLAVTPGLWFVIFVPIVRIIIAQREVVLAWLSANIFNNLQIMLSSDRDAKYLRTAIFYGITMFVVFIAEWLLSTISDMIENYWRERTNLKLKRRFMQKDYKMDAAYFDDPDKQSHRSIVESVDPVGEIMSVVSVVGKLCSAVSFAVIMWQYSPLFIPVALLIQLPTYFINNRLITADRKFRLASDPIIRERDYYKSVPVDKSDVKEYKVFSMTEYIVEKYKKTSSLYFKKYRGHYIRDSVGTDFIREYLAVINLVSQIVLGFSVFVGKILFGEYTLLLAAFNNLSGSISVLMDFSAECHDMHEQNELLLDYFDESTIFERSEACARKVEKKPHTMELRGVSFRYPGCEKYVLRDISMTLEPGKSYGLVGLNGCGKSTLVNILLRLYEPESGEILLDGVNIKEYEINSYYSAFACVFQSATKYSMTIRDYISAGKECDAERLENAIKRAGLDEWCGSLPGGADTMLTRAFTSENSSVEPSIGQWQKLSIARAIYRDSEIMILDEPSASLDVDAENEIFGYITALSENKTSLLISHRLSNIMDCDRIFLMRDGSLAEQGAHRELLEQDGEYAKLYMMQAKHYQSA